MDYCRRKYGRTSHRFLFVMMASVLQKNIRTGYLKGFIVSTRAIPRKPAVQVCGLSIVKHGAILHGAALSLQSEPGKGTEITIDFGTAADTDR